MLGCMSGYQVLRVRGLENLTSVAQEVLLVELAAAVDTLQRFAVSVAVQQEEE